MSDSTRTVEHMITRTSTYLLGYEKNPDQRSREMRAFTEKRLSSHLHHRLNFPDATHAIIFSPTHDESKVT